MYVAFFVYVGPSVPYALIHTDDLILCLVLFMSGLLESIEGFVELPIFDFSFIYASDVDFVVGEGCR